MLGAKLWYYHGDSDDGWCGRKLYVTAANMSLESNGCDDYYICECDAYVGPSDVVFHHKNVKRLTRKIVFDDKTDVEEELGLTDADENIYG